jgi:DNA mismatch endonuclease (patch repair protein)
MTPKELSPQSEVASSSLSRSPVPSSEGVRSRMRLQKNRDTECEVLVRRILWRLGLRYRVDFRPEPGLRRRADVVFTGARVAVFIDGCFWHQCPRHGRWPAANQRWWRAKLRTTAARDADTAARLRRAGWVVMRFWEHETPGAVAGKIFRRVQMRSSGRRAR